MTAAEIVKALNGRGNSAPCPVPGHGKGRGDRRHSLSVHDGIDGKILAKCHAGCPQAEVWSALKRLERGSDDDIRRPIDAPVRRRKSDPEDNQRVSAAKSIWAESVPATGTPAQDYLAGRGILIQVPEAIRYHLPTDALIAAVRDRSDAITGIQRVFLEQDAAGVWHRGRYSLGRCAGGAVRLTPLAAHLQLAESVEDALALMQMTGRATWAVPGAGFMEKFEPPPGCETVVLTPDNDAAGRKAVRKAARVLTRRGLTVRVWLPPIEGSDWCDFLDRWEERAGLIEEGDGLDRAGAEDRAYRMLSDANCT